MSAGGGKVYFVLYLAVVLELLIIIVDRDDAEEGLRKQTAEIQLIVQRILASLQTSGTQITTTPRDEITLDPTNPKHSNEDRTYYVNVNVGDTSALRGTSGFEINKLLYTLSYDKDTAAVNRTDTGNYMSILPVPLNGANYSEPVNIVLDSNTYPVHKDIVKHKQTFLIHFKPDQEGVYRLRFNTNVNQIIGVDLDPNNSKDISDPLRLAQVVRIGSVPLTVKQLLAVYKTLQAPKKNLTGTAVDDDSTRVKLKDFIGKLLFGGSTTLESNNGEIKFDVLVRKLKVPPSAKLDISPQVRRFTAFVGVPIPNLIKANVKQIKFDAPQYGEFFQTADSTWYWKWAPSAADAGKMISLTYTAHANRNAGPLDNATDTFSVQVQKLAFTDNAWFNPKFYAVKGIVPVGDSVTFGRHYKDLEGIYKYELKLAGKTISEVTGQDLRFGLSDDKLGQTAELIVSFKTKEMSDFLRTDSVRLPVGPRLLYPTISNSTIIAGQPLQMDIQQGMSNQIALPAGTIVTVEDDQGGKFFKREITMNGGSSITVSMNPGVNVSNSTPVTIHIKSNIPNQIDDEEPITINPRPRKR